MTEFFLLSFLCLIYSIFLFFSYRTRISNWVVVFLGVTTVLCSSYIMLFG